jgi:hypothetical protein
MRDGCFAPTILKHHTGGVVGLTPMLLYSGGNYYKQNKAEINHKE